VGAVAVIPARMGSTRFPGKALASDTGTPLVVHVCERAAGASSIDRVVVATDAAEIADAVRSHGFEAVMTGAHPNGTSRIAEAAERLGLDAARVVVNVQGDEPEIEPGVIDAAASALGDDASLIEVGTVATPIDAGSDPDPVSDPNVVKVVLARRDGAAATALYFSRAPIPYDRDGPGPGSGPGSSAGALRHVGIYAYRVGALRVYGAMEETPLERTERLEQLRWLEHGVPIRVALARSDHAGIDTPAQYGAFVERHAARSG